MNKGLETVNKHPGNECQFLYDELWATLHRCSREATLSYVNMFGVIKMIELELMKEYNRKYE